MIIMSIKWAFCRISWNNLEIKFKTKFALNSVKNTDTMALLNWALISMWINNISVKLI
jgi:hypothetical protein